MTQLEHDINELEKKRQTVGLSVDEKKKLLALQEEWIEIESSKYGRCLSCYI